MRDLRHDDDDDVYVESLLGRGELGGGIPEIRRSRAQREDLIFASLSLSPPRRLETHVFFGLEPRGFSLIYPHSLLSPPISFPFDSSLLFLLSRDPWETTLPSFLRPEVPGGQTLPGGA